MPRNDRTGPMGLGSKTGRGLGLCNTKDNKTLDNTFGRGFGRGRGLGQGNGRGLGRLSVGQSTNTADSGALDKLSGEIGLLTQEVKNLLAKLSK